MKKKIKYLPYKKENTLKRYNNIINAIKQFR